MLPVASKCIPGIVISSTRTKVTITLRPHLVESQIDTIVYALKHDVFHGYMNFSKNQPKNRPCQLVILIGVENLDEIIEELLFRSEDFKSVSVDIDVPNPNKLGIYW